MSKFYYFIGFHRFLLIFIDFHLFSLISIDLHLFFIDFGIRKKEGNNSLGQGCWTYPSALPLGRTPRPYLLDAPEGLAGPSVSSHFGAAGGPGGSPRLLVILGGTGVPSGPPRFQKPAMRTIALE